jgi:hypothetical protein
MSRSLAGLVVLILLVGDLRAAQYKEQPHKDCPQATRVTITRIDEKKGEITVKSADGMAVTLPAVVPPTGGFPGRPRDRWSRRNDFRRPFFPYRW